MKDSRIGVFVEIILLKLVSNLVMRMTSPHGELEMSPFLSGRSGRLTIKMRGDHKFV